MTALPDARGLVALLVDRGATLATAESLTGGRLAAAVTGVPGASAAYVGGIVAYATRVKQELLGVPDALVATHGVVSAECARAMASGVRTALDATWGISTTGVAGPDRQEGKPVGTVFVGLAGPAGSEAVELSLAGDRADVQDQTVGEAIATLVWKLRREEPGLR
ncbi:CinA family protein [Nocardioides aestuarii]|uniref:CinA family protein n=1 Tax=Nocardioides aestuarii TaxID=252231 RepID=A0ABW4TVD4_9ACTN